MVFKQKNTKIIHENNYNAIINYLDVFSHLYTLKIY